MENLGETTKMSKALPLLERMNLANTLMLAKSQYYMANTFIPDKLLLPIQQKITTFFTNNQFTQNNIKMPKNKGGINMINLLTKRNANLIENFNIFSHAIQNTTNHNQLTTKSLTYTK
eukprot:Pgem_evm1s7726